MTRLSKYLMLLLIVIGMISCNNYDKKLPNTGSKQNQFSKQQQYTIDTSGISILWTAYKFTNKTGVSGTFKTYKLENKKASGTVENILNKSKLSIPTATVNSSNPIRDFKLVTYFFKVFNTSEITGTITKAKAIETAVITETFSLKKTAIITATNTG